MSYCKNCGQKLPDDAKFCPACGTKNDEITIETKRKEEYQGKIIKCPQCGEPLDSFAVVCPSCGYELRGVDIANSVKCFSRNIEETTSIEQKVTLIRNYPIPNTKEDIFEFMILASSSVKGEFNEELFNAWIAKFEQCYQKASISFKGDQDFKKIQDFYNQTIKQIKQEKVEHSKNKISKGLTPNPVFAIVAVLLLIWEIIRIVKGDFAGIDVIFCAIVLWCVFKITYNKRNG